MINTQVFVFMIPAVVIGSYGSIYLKLGAAKFTLNPRRIRDNLTVLFGLSMYGVSMILYLTALRYGDLSVVYPLSAMSYILIPFLSIKKLGEKMSNIKWMGIVLIILGSLMVVM